MVAAVERLVAAGVALGQCGVICIYRAQVALVRSLLDRRLPALQGQQRRARRAAALAGGSSSCEAEALALGAPGSGGGGGTKQEEDEEGGSDQQSIQVATVDSFQARPAGCWPFGAGRAGRAGRRVCCWRGSGGGQRCPLSLNTWPCCPGVQGAECDVILLTTAVTRASNFAAGERGWCRCRWRCRRSAPVWHATLQGSATLAPATRLPSPPSLPSIAHRRVPPQRSADARQAQPHHRRLRSGAAAVGAGVCGAACALPRHARRLLVKRAPARARRCAAGGRAARTGAAAVGEARAARGHTVGRRAAGTVAAGGEAGAAAVAA